MNSLNSSLVDAGVWKAIAVAKREGEAATGASGACRAYAGILAIGVALGQTDGDVVLFGLEGTELLEWEDL